MRLINNDKYVVIEGTGLEMRAVKDFLTVIDKPHLYDSRPSKDKSVCLLFRDDDKYMTYWGMTKVLQEKFGAELVGFDHGLGVKYFNELVIKNCLPGISLLDFQVDAVTKAIMIERGMINIPPAGGKTEILLATLRLLNKKSLTIVPTVPLANQLLLRANNYGFDDFGIYTGGNKFIGSMHTVATPQTITNLLVSAERDWLNEVQILAMDEGHHMQCNSWRYIFGELPNIRYILGFTATPYRSGNIFNDPLDIVTFAITGGIIFEVDMKYLVDIGLVLAPEVYMDRITTSGNIKSFKSWSACFRSFIERNSSRNARIAKFIKMANDYGLISMTLVSTIKHADLLFEAVDEQVRYDTVVVTGNARGRVYDGSIRKVFINYEKVLEKLQNGEIKHIIATPVFDEGVNAPSVDLVILGFAGRSIIKIPQRIGRGMRKSGDGDSSTTTIVIDFFDEGHIFLKAQSMFRLQFYKNNDIRMISSIHELEEKMMGMYR